MHFSTLATALVAAAVSLPAALAAGSSPMLVLSSSRFTENLDPIVSRASFGETVAETLGCNDILVIYGSTNHDLTTVKSAAAGSVVLEGLVEKSADSSIVPHVQAGISVAQMAGSFETVCAQINRRTVTMDFTRDNSLVWGDVAEWMAKTTGKESLVVIASRNDESRINQLVNTELSTFKWTLLATNIRHGAVEETLSRPAGSYSALTGLKSSKKLPWSKRALLDKYVFFGPGIFMAYVIMAPILAIAFVGAYLLTTLDTPKQIVNRSKTASSKNN